MKLYRIVPIRKCDKSSYSELKKEFYKMMCDMGLYCPSDLELQYQKVTFYFTEYGWKNIGEKCYISLKDKFQINLITGSIPDNSPQIVFKDINQVAIHYKFNVGGKTK